MPEIEIELSPPTPAELTTAWKLLRRFGVASKQDALLLATCGTVENGRDVMHAAGLVVLDMTCYCCKANKLDPSDKDALGLELCPPCYEGAGLENEHTDDGHDMPVAGCPSCA
jgi:hypothetical protein